MSDTDITVLKEFYLEKIEKLEAENRRLREALTKIVNAPTHRAVRYTDYDGAGVTTVYPADIKALQEIAKQAIEKGSE